MAHLLGSKNCVESLCKDVCQLQEVITPLLKITGRVEFSSWKYPCENACDINVKEIIENYCFCQDEDANKLSHIILLEMVIDRFCLLLQCVSQLFDMSVTLGLSHVRSHLETCTFTSTISVGLVATLFKKKVLQVQESYMKMEKELSEHNQSLMDLQNLVHPKRNRYLSAKKEQISSSDKKKQLNSSEIFIGKKQSISTQTFETAFLPCLACSNMQNCLITIGSAIISICESQGLPSLLAKYKRAYKDVEMTNLDIQKWSTEQERDLQKVCKHLEDLQGKVLPLEADLIKSKAICVQLQEDVDAAFQQKVFLENELLTLTKLHETKTEQYLLQEELLNQNLNEIKILENELSVLRQKEAETNRVQVNQSSAIKNFETQVENLSNELENARKELQMAESRVQEILCSNQEIQRNADIKLQVNLENVNNLTEELTKLNAENKVLMKHDQGLQEKQSKLLSRIEQLEDCADTIKIQLVESQQICENMRNENENLKFQANKAEEKLDAYENKTKEEYHKLTELSEKIKLLVCYPVIGLEFESAEKEYLSILSDLKYKMPSEDDIVSDLLNQISANEIRVTILLNQISSLKNSLAKLQLINSGRINLKNNYTSFKNGNMSIESFSQLPKPPFESSLKVNLEDSFTPKPPCEPRTSSRIARPRSSNKNETSDAFDDLKASDRIMLDEAEASWNSKNAAAKNTKSPILNQLSCVCPDCDKSYLSSEDLEIHRAFCYGRI